MKLLRAVFLIVLAFIALAPAAHAFAGRNGAIVYGWKGIFGEETDEGAVEGGIWMLPPGPFQRRAVLHGCNVVPQGAPEASDCLALSYRDPSVSADGRRVAFDDGASLAVVNIDGSDFRELPSHNGDGDPAWSPSGTRISFVEHASSGASVWICDAQGGHARQLASGSQPAWSARNWIAFVRGGRIYRIRPDGSGLRRLTGAGSRSPAWSPHGTRLVYLREGHSGGLFVIDADGRHAQRLARGSSSGDVVWSPDGRELLFDGYESLSAYDLRTHRSRDTLAGGNATGAGYDEHTSGFDWQPLR